MRVEPRPTPGINVIGFLEGELGLGEVARKLVAAAEYAELPVATLNYTRTNSRQEQVFDQRGSSNAPYDTNIICVNAEGMKDVRKDLGPDLFASRYTIGVWFWELSDFPPAMWRALDLVDEVWVASDFVREALQPVTTKPVLVVPVPLDSSNSRPAAREALALPECFLFLFSFDFFSVLQRKNPLGLIEAFRRAFAPDEGPVLFIKTINGETKRDELESLRRAAGGRGDIRVVDMYFSPGDMAALLASCDCYVSLHRSEGLGLGMADAMALGKPVIATGYSGNLTFMDDRNSYLVRHGMSMTPAGIDPYPQGVEWAEPDLDHAASLLRHVYDNQAEARERGARARRDILESHTLERSATFIRERVAELPKHERLLRDVRGPIERAAALVDREAGSALDAPGRTGFFRRSLRRLLWPELEHQRRLDAELVQALRQLERVTREELGRRERARRTEPGSDVDPSL